MSSSFELISHPAEGGKPARCLKDHLEEVGSISKQLAEILSLDKFHLRREHLSELTYLIGVCHDFGKATTFFQKYIRDPANPDRSEKRFHSQISSLFGYYVVSKLMENEEFAYVAYYVIYYHHGDLAELITNYDRLSEKYQSLVETQSSDILEHSLTELQAVYDSLLGRGRINLRDFLSPGTLSTLRGRIYKWVSSFIVNGSTAMDSYFTFLLVYSILLYSDKLSASGIGYDKIAGEKERWSSLTASVIDNYVSGLSSNAGQNDSSPTEINVLRNEAYREVMDSLQSLDISTDRFLLIELPTGLGKTMTSVGSALRLREMVFKKFGYRPKIIYSMPFLSIVDDNFDKITKAMSPVTGGAEAPTSLLLKHHHLAEVFFSFSREGNHSDTESYTSRDMEKRYLLMEGWNSEVVVTTFIQLFHSIITNRNSSAMKFLNITNSIIIIDEVQAIRTDYLNLVREVLKYIAEKLNSWIIFMTATMPAFLEPGDAKNLIKNPQDYFFATSRSRYRRVQKSLTLEELAAEIFSIVGKDIMVVMNTIESSHRLYLLLRSLLINAKREPGTENDYADFGDVRLMYLSTAVTPHQRKNRIDLIKQKREHRDETCSQIVVTTQLVEAGVDIDFDIVMRDFAPLDSIVQAGGRANRNGSYPLGEVRLVRLVDDMDKGYAERIYDAVLLDITRGMLDESFSSKDVISEAEMHRLIHSYYERVRQRKSNKNSKKYLEDLEFLRFDELHKFSLIEKTYEKADVFIPLDRDAEKIWKEYLFIRGIHNALERHEKMLGIRNSFYDYVVSVNRNLVGEVDEPVVNAAEFSIEWDRETGVKGRDLIW